MSEVILCNKPFNASLFKQQCAIDTDPVGSCDMPELSLLKPYRPYQLKPSQNHLSRSLVNQLSVGNRAKTITDFSLAMGSEAVTALAKVKDDFKNQESAFIGSGVGVASSRLDGFAKAVKRYEEALNRYQQNKNTGNRMHVKMAYNKMSLQFSREFNHAQNQATNANRSPLFNMKRALNIAKDSRNESSIAKLQVTNQAQVNSLARFGSHAKFLTNNLAAIDFTSRSAGIINTAKYGGNWHKEMFVESSGFAAGGGMGILASRVGFGLVSALPMVAALTPMGLVILVGVGLTVASMSILTDSGSKELAESYYDSIMKWLLN
ncbi:hypothetical protein NBRC116592_18650 [Colwellia sp. KU-HH00111]|uniref:hypothetical protein n=1 Tax=Colwellia sp. KU-HH00111 TaxID=3127652 RepID=UPI003103DE05